MTRQFGVLLFLLLLVGVFASACAAPEAVTSFSDVTSPARTETVTAVVTEAVTASAANADVLFVAAHQEADKSWSFEVTVAHPDQGWEDYADGWDVVLPDGTTVKPDPSSPFTRLLLHPHETEQPFTRSQRGIIIPEDVTLVTVRAHDLLDGFGGHEVVVDLAASAGPDFAVTRQ